MMLLQHGEEGPWEPVPEVPTINQPPPPLDESLPKFQQMSLILQFSQRITSIFN